jgi:N-methylhydantoinase A
MTYVVGVDIGGTFTDCAVMDDGGRITIAKAPSTPADFSDGFFGAMEKAATSLELDLRGLLSDTTLIAHGTTVATNAMVQRQGARVGVLTTAGHRDVLQMMRAYGRVAGLPPAELMHYAGTSKPSPIVPRELIYEVHERVDSRGEVVFDLDEAAAAEVIRTMLADGVDSVAISLLWSFKNDAHERKLAELVREQAPDIFLTISSELVPRWGEYERTMAVAINSYVGPVTRDYVARIAAHAQELGYARPVLLMECSGGVAAADRAAHAPVRLIGSGPTGGVIGSRFLGERMGYRNIVATDMGGTTFDVGLIIDGEAAGSSTSIVDQFEYFVPSIDVRSIGAGGGSIAWFDSDSGTIRVGPQSAGADPGPVCYGQGATAPTVTDADVVLGYIDPEYFLGGTISLDVDSARKALEELGRPLGRSAMEVAAGITQIVDFHMADLIRKMTVELGRDPRDLVVFAYGGAGPLHGAAYARELGASTLIVPLASTASVWSALGVVSSDVLHVYERSAVISAPWDANRVEGDFRQLESRALDEMAESGFSAGDVTIERLAEIRYSLQVHVVEVPVPAGPLDETAMSELTRAFEQRYEALFGEGTGYAAAGFDIVTLRVRAFGRTTTPSIAATDSVGDRKPGADALKPSRSIWWHELDGAVETQIFDGTLLEAGHVLDGPCVIELPDTTATVRPDQTARIDELGNIVIDL